MIKRKIDIPMKCRNVVYPRVKRNVNKLLSWVAVILVQVEEASAYFKPIFRFPISLPPLYIGVITIICASKVYKIRSPVCIYFNGGCIS